MFSFVQLNSKNTEEIQDRYKSHPSLDTVLLFNEDSERPVASVSMSDIPTQTLSNIVASNQYLALPRLSSQDMLEGNYFPNTQLKNRFNLYLSVQ